MKIIWILLICLFSKEITSETRISPQAFIDINGKGILIYEDQEAHTINSAIFDGTNWSNSFVLSTAGLNSSNAKLAFDFTTGNGAAIWTSLDPVNSVNLLYGTTYSVSTGTWDPVVQITTNSVNVNPNYMMVFITSLPANPSPDLNSALATWSQTNGINIEVATAFATVIEGWSNSYRVIT